MSDLPAKPAPRQDAASADYWAHSARGELMLQRCAACGHVQHYPRRCCSACQAQTLDTLVASGRGRVRSFTIIRRAVSAAFDADVPYIVALIELAEGPTLMTNLLEVADVERVRIGDAVTLCFEQRGEVAVPQFRPAS